MVAIPISSAATVADEMLKIAKRRGIGLTPMQLIKLVYISHGWSLAILGRDLFSDRIEAWQYGPVIPSLYHATKQFGRSKIPFHLIDDDVQSPLPKDVQEFLEDVFEKYGNLSGIALSNLTHRPGSPWDMVYEKGVRNNEIPDELIKHHYVAKLNEQRSTSSG